MSRIKALKRLDPAWTCHRDGMSWSYTRKHHGCRWLITLSSALPYGSDDESDAYPLFNVYIDGKWVGESAVTIVDAVRDAERTLSRDKGYP